MRANTIRAVGWRRRGRYLYRRALRLNAKRQLRRLRGRSALPDQLLQVLEETVLQTASSPENRWLAEIARLRYRLERSSETLEVVDFGAGLPDERRTEEEMRSGVTVGCTVAELCHASKDDFWGGMLFRLVREFRPRSALELGTNLGISASYQAAAMELNGTGHLVTLEGAPAVAQKARENLASLSLDNVTVVVGRFDEVLATICADYGPFDFVFIDGHHDEAATLRYFHEIVAFAQPGAVLVFDDIEYSEGMRRAWTAIQEHDGVSVAVGLSKVGVCIFGQGATKQRERLLLV